MKAYLEILEKILNSPYSVHKPTRTGTDTLSLSGAQFEHDMRDGFPLLTTKKMGIKSISAELEFFIKGLSDKRWLQERGCHIWDEWANIKSLPDNNNNMKNIYMKESNDLGPIYGFEWRNFNGWYKPNPQIITGFDIEYKKYIDNSQNKSGMIGNIYKSNRFDEFVVIKEYYIGNQLKFDIKFLTNGYTLYSITKQNILKGECRNYYYPKNYGVACIGDKNIIQHPLYKKLRTIWEGMISRCYHETDVAYYLYGKRGVYVCNRWLILSNFIEDVQKLLNWNLKINDWKNYSLDKDYLGKGYYSPESCVWLSKENQILYSRMVDKNFNSHLYKKGTDQLKTIIDRAKKDPLDRRLIVSSWNTEHLEIQALPPCHYAWQILSDGTYLDLIWVQRSCDTFLGIPYNIASYGLLLTLLGKELNLMPRRLVGQLADTHIYANHMEQVELQLSREPYQLPQIEILNFTSIFDWQYTDVKLNDYYFHPKIEAPIAI